MTFALPDEGTEFDARVARRLDEAVVAWFTVVDGAGTPQPAPVWFVWDGETALVYSDYRAKRLDHVRARCQTALNLDGDGAGGDIVVLAGETHVDAVAPAVPDNPAYLAKYGERITNGWGSAEEFAKTYSVALRFLPKRLRGY
ncbi:TIGR03667 family PPOX class F420-dependent oxidoreductase [Pseudonocardia aurantiaca]|uniref:TIGR03667 family PPOX class F420-dependent oxidoreductase n=1 Tax=Pseudonocardia aurantiaca TaxID=75290 RepID=A0ABW4FK82_9PSEU